MGPIWTFAAANDELRADQWTLDVIKTLLDVCHPMLEMIISVIQGLYFSPTPIRPIPQTPSGTAAVVPPPVPAVNPTLHPGSAKSFLSQPMIT